MPYFRNNCFSLFNRERRKSAVYFHTITSSRWFVSIAASWKDKLLRSPTLKIASVAKAKRKHSILPKTFAQV